MKKMIACLLLAILLLSSISTIAESSTDSFVPIDFHPELSFEVPDYLQSLASSNAVLFFENIKDDKAIKDTTQAWYGDFLTVFSITPDEEVTQENYLNTLAYYREDLLKRSIELVNEWQAQAWKEGEDFYIMTPGMFGDFAPRDWRRLLGYGAYERSATRAMMDPNQPEGFQDGIRYVLCYENFNYWSEKMDLFTFNIHYWIYLYPTETTLYAFTYVKPLQDNDLTYIDPDVERLFLSVQPREKSEAEQYYDQYLELVEQDMTAALEALEKAIETDPNIAHFYNHYSIRLSNLGRNDDALNAAQKAVELKPQDPYYHDVLSVMLSRANRYEEALDAIDQALELSPDNVQFHLGRVSILVNLERYDEAVEESRIAVSLNPENADCWDYLSTELGLVGQFEEALKAIETAITLRPNKLTYYRSASVLAFNMGDNEKSLNYLELGLAIKPDDADYTFLFPNRFEGYADLYYSKFTVLNLLGRYDEALEAIEHVLEITPSQELYGEYGETLFNAKQYDTAVEIANSLESSYGPTATYHALRAESYYYLKLYKEALEDVEAGLQMNDQMGRLYRVGASALFQLGRYKEALEKIDGGLAQRPDEEQYQKIREKILLALDGQVEELESAEPHVVIISTSSVNLRAEGNADSAALGRAKPGDVFPCTGVAKSGWYEIQLPDGRTAYVSNKMAELVE